MNKQKLLLSLLLLLSSTTQKINLDQAEGVITSALTGYKIQKNVKNTAQQNNITIRMDTTLGEHLMDISLKEINEKLEINFFNAKSVDLKKLFQFNFDTFKLQKEAFKELFKRMIVSPGSVVNFFTIEEMKEELRNNFKGLDVEEKNSNNNSVLIFRSNESVVAVFEFFLSEEVIDENSKNFFINLKAKISLNNKEEEITEKISIFEEGNILDKIRHILDISNHVNNKNDVNSIYQSIFPKDKFKIKQISSDNLEDKVIISLENSHVLTKIKYIEEENSIGSYEVELFTITDLNHNQLKIDEKRLLNFEFKRMLKKNLLDKFKEMDFDEIFKTINGEVIKMYLEHYEEIYKPVFKDYNNEDKKEKVKGNSMFKGTNKSENIIRTVKAWNLNKSTFIAYFEVQEVDGNVNIKFKNTLADNNYDFSIAVKGYNKEIVRGFIKMVLNSNVNYRK